jgi:transaldolase/glucose-6-phosphate isomerase
VGAAEAPRRFVAITDPGSALESEARERGFRHVVHGRKDVGGRFSALSAFGLFPATLAGLDADLLLGRARAMRDACRGADALANPGVSLGLALATHARSGRDKLTLAASPPVAAMGAWIEQLVAESTGKKGIGVLPFDGERLGGPALYGDDRVFAQLRLADGGDGGDGGDRAADDADDADGALGALAALERAGHPVLRMELRDREDVAAEFVRWEVATAVAGAVLGIDPFDQPDVEASKIAARDLMMRYEETGRLDDTEVIARDGALRLHGPCCGAFDDVLAAHLAQIRPGDYFAILAYVEQSARNEAPLQELRHAVRDARRCATSLGFGPRFLHSTGQAFAGGPPSGVFLMVTCDDERDVPLAGRRGTFGIVKAAQAGGNLRVLEERGRRVLRVHVEGPMAEGLAQLARAVTKAVTR